MFTPTGTENSHLKEGGRNTGNQRFPRVIIIVKEGDHMKINENQIVVNGQPIGVYDLYETERLVCNLTSDKSMQEVLLTGTQTILEVLQNSVDQRLVSSFRIEHK